MHIRSVGNALCENTIDVKILYCNALYISNFIHYFSALHFGY